MAYSPCPVGGHMYPGKGVSVYPAVLNGSHELRKKRKLCPQHFRVMMEEVIAKMTLVTERTLFPDGFERQCSFCGQLSLADSQASVFVTWYEAGADRIDAFGVACAGCWDAVVMGLHLDGLGAA